MGGPLHEEATGGVFIFSQWADPYTRKLLVEFSYFHNGWTLTRGSYWWSFHIFTMGGPLHEEVTGGVFIFSQWADPYTRKLLVEFSYFHNGWTLT